VESWRQLPAPTIHDFHLKQEELEVRLFTNRAFAFFLEHRLEASAGRLTITVSSGSKN
jgi:hypothetical protein